MTRAGRWYAVIALSLLVLVVGIELPSVRRALSGTGMAETGAGSWGAAGSPAALSFSPGLTPAFTLPLDAQPIKGAALGAALVVLALPEGERNLSLFLYDGQAIDRRALPLPTAGSLAGLAAGHDGTIWVAAGDSLVRVDSGGGVRRLSIPRPRYVFPPELRGPASPAGLPPTEDGQATALAIGAEGDVLIGRLGFPEITTFDPRTSAFDAMPLPNGSGDVATFATGPQGLIFFTVNRSGTTPGLLFDALGIYDSRGHTARVIPQPARSVAANTQTVVVAGYGIGRIDGTGTIRGRVLPGAAYDETQIGLGSDGVTVIKVAGASPEVAFLDANGRELRRVTYAAVMTADRSGATRIYSSAFAFVVDVGGSNWFALFGRPEVYRLN